MSQSAQQPANTGGRTHMEQLLDAQATAWNQGDGTAWAAAFSDDADFVNIRGDVFTGRAAIAQQHARIFSGPFKGSHTRITLRRFAQPEAAMALVDAEYEVTGFAALPPGIVPTEPGLLRTHMKYVAVQKDGNWQFVAAQNTAILPAMPRH